MVNTAVLILTLITSLWASLCICCTPPPTRAVFSGKLEHGSESRVLKRPVDFLLAPLGAGSSRGIGVSMGHGESRRRRLMS